MRQLTYVGPRRFEWYEVPAPRLTTDTDAIVRPLTVARCDLDFYIAQGHPSFPGRLPMAMKRSASSSMPASKRASFRANGSSYRSSSPAGGAMPAGKV
jgi:hypothetical protein